MFRAQLTDLFPDLYIALTGEESIYSRLLPRHADDTDTLEELVKNTSLTFAQMIRNLISELNAEQNDVVLPEPVYLSNQYYISRYRNSDNFVLTLCFEFPEQVLETPRDLVLGVDWGQRNLLSIAVSDHIQDVQHWQLPAAALQWVEANEPVG